MSFGSDLKAAIKDADRETILTDRIHEWRRENFGGAQIPEEVWMRVGQTVMRKANDDRTGRFGASSRGMCMRQQMLTYSGLLDRAYDPGLSEIFNDGTWRHMRWQAEGLTAGWFTDIEVTYKMPHYRVKVSMDGINTDEGWGFELKGTSALHTIEESGVPDKHLDQIHTMMFAANLDTFVYMAECKRSQKFHEVVIHRDEERMARVIEEIDRLNFYADEAVLPDVLSKCKEHKGPDYKSCPYKSACLSLGKDVELPEVEVSL